jgi:hypothetical protein
MVSTIGDRKQKHRSAAECHKLVRAWKESGKTKRLWCAENGLSLESLRRWIKRFRGGPIYEMPIVELPHPCRPPEASTVRILVNAAIQIELPREASEELLQRVLRAAVEVSHVR